MSVAASLLYTSFLLCLVEDSCHAFWYSRKGRGMSKDNYRIYLLCYLIKFNRTAHSLPVNSTRVQNHFPKAFFYSRCTLTSSYIGQIYIALEIIPCTSLKSCMQYSAMAKMGVFLNISWSKQENCHPQPVIQKNLLMCIMMLPGKMSPVKHFAGRCNVMFQTYFRLL